MATGGPGGMHGTASSRSCGHVRLDQHLVSQKFESEQHFRDLGGGGSAQIKWKGRRVE